MKKKSIQLHDKRVIEVSELPLIKYAELIRAFDTLPKKLSSFKELEFKSILEQLPVVISEALPEFINIIAVTTELKKEEIEQLGLSTVVKIVEAVMEVNDYDYLFSMVKKALARYQGNKKTSLPDKTIGSGGQ